MPKVQTLTSNYEEICKCCKKCGKTFYKKGNNQKIIERQVNMFLRLHSKKCKGTKNLNDVQVFEITDCEINKQNFYHCHKPISTLKKDLYYF